jgi:hypothetical protein
MTAIPHGMAAAEARAATATNLCAVVAGPTHHATAALPRAGAAATRHGVTASPYAAVATPARPATTATPDAPAAPAPHRRPTSRAPHHPHSPHHRTPLPVTHPKGTPCR